ncbi:carboxypeptidase M32 [Deinococcus maricopensis]|uniref:Metal-dependent carboxypeptidase n=1 Tax=Deinococcus maricopensis (strain DSM 21211 / LMG 22137 / NRRL B-23946 / LB-34) TaxID=709986 RepID=E8U7Z2_DEIML|nr:carboxypeptidase M32 [Deinococcus maricopensis]ADV67181.1 Carboxypeptidase Taq [Deinococcus maricopensis DSM 21211]
MTNNDTAWQALQAHWQELADLSGIGALLGWDQSTYMPRASAGGRARQRALLSGLHHARATDAAYGRLLDAAERRTDLTPEQGRAVQLARKHFEDAARVPAAFVTTWTQHGGESYSAWVAARPANDFARVVPYLEKSLDLSRQAAAFFPEFSDPMDYFVDQSDEGMNATRVDAVFAELRATLVPLVEAVTNAPAPRTDFLHRHYPQDAQLRFGEDVIRAYGYDFDRGRQDLTHHPFMTRLGERDVRITTRVKPHDLTECLYSTLHEAGHALYEQGVDDAYLGTPLGQGASAGVHESQSRLWENLVGRSRAFWAAYFGKFRDAFPEQLHDVTEEELYRAVNVVSRSLIRTDADELTYNLHVITRYELERQLLSGRLAVRDLADAWHAAYEQNLGVRAPSDEDGVLQDVHWYFGQIGGAFQGYTLGNVLSAQFYAAAQAAHPTLDADIARGEFGRLHGWLREHVYAHGRRFTPDELVQRATGEALSARPYLTYLRGKYSELYSL